MLDNQSLEQKNSYPLDIFKETFWAMKELKNIVVDDKLTNLEKTITQPLQSKEKLPIVSLEEQAIQEFGSYLDKILVPEEKNDFMNIFPGTDIITCIQSFIEEKQYITLQAQKWNIIPYKKLEEAFLAYPQTYQHLKVLLEDFYKKYTKNSVQRDDMLQDVIISYSELKNGIKSVNANKSSSKIIVPALSPDITSLMVDSQIEWKNSDNVIYHEIIDKEWLSQEAFVTAYKAFTVAKDQWLLTKDRFLTVVDYSKSNKEDRLFVVDLYNRKVVLKSTAGHGKWSGKGEYVDEFSNISWSKQTSAGLFKTSGRVERASHGRREWLRLYGLEKWLNDKAANRGIFIHKSTIKGSEWCITIPNWEKASFINKVLVWWYPIYNYTNKKEVLAQSELLEQSLYPIAA